ncbi:MAG: hypothetical protein HQ474_06855 [Flammeovirgaceae bacterium]|mgnify:FL=1|jgi:hypothetical protein|nr:hypothetical protein [Flammeovirgaceae bacterium]|tara:strand:+ start:670 stop:912 length:243 start_codon:yes stop_codon:yes gene_type:complete
MSNCPSRKRIFYTSSEAEEELLRIHVKYQNSTTATFYTCDDCGYFHLTSSGDQHQVVKRAFEDGKIDQMRESAFWTKKIK